MHAGEMRPPLTVVLINNAGGGIFSFLPIAEELPPDTFSQLWATPQNVDLAGAQHPSPQHQPPTLCLLTCSKENYKYLAIHDIVRGVTVAVVPHEGCG